MPADNTPDEDEDFIPIYLADQYDTVFRIEEGSVTLPPIQMPEPTTLVVENAILSHLTTIEQFYSDKPALFKKESDHQQFIAGIRKAINLVNSGDLKTAISETAEAGALINQNGMKDWINEYTVRDMVKQVIDWSELPPDTKINYQPADNSQADFLFYLSSMSTTFKEEVFFAMVDEEVAEQEEESIVQVETSAPIIPEEAEPVSLGLFSLDCGWDADQNMISFEINGPPGYYWSLFASTEAPVEGNGNYISSEVQIDLIDAYLFYFFEDEASGNFDSSGVVREETFGGFAPGTKMWFQAISVESFDILVNGPSRDQVLISNVCSLEF